MRGRPARALAAVLMAGGLAACGGTSEDAGGTLPGLCDAIAAPDAATAAEVFERDVHRPLHDLADEVASVDRGVASTLLEAKFAVETVVRGDTEVPHALVRQRLDDLQTRVHEALETLDRPAAPC